MKKLSMSSLPDVPDCRPGGSLQARPGRWSIPSTPPGDPDYGVPTSFEPVATMQTAGARKNEDVSKNAALIPPGFGTASADTLNTGTPPHPQSGA